MEEERKKQKNTLMMAVVTAFISSFMGSALNLSIPALEQQFHTSAAIVGWTMTAFTLVVAALSVPMGKIADATSRRRVLLIGISAFGLLTLLCATATSIGMLIALRGLQGGAAAMIFATNNAILISVFPGNKRGSVLGISTAATYIGLTCGPVIGGFLNYQFGWQSIFYVTACVAVLAFGLAWRGAPHNAHSHRMQVDLAGTLLYIGMISMLLLGLSNLSIFRFSWVILLIGVVLGILFFMVERKVVDPVVRVTMFTEDVSFTLSNFAALLNYGATFAVSYLGSVYLQVVMGYTSRTAGLILICMPAVQAIFSPTMGRLSDRIAPHKLASAGMGLCALGLVGFSFLDTNTPLWFVIVALLIEGFGFALFSSPNTNAIMGRVQPKDYGVANSILATMRTTGQSASMAIVTIVVGATLGSQSLMESTASQVVQTIRVSFYIFIVLCFIGIFFSLKRNQK